MTRRAVTWAAFALGLVLLWRYTPPDLPLCGFRWITGHPCPLCGMTHAIFALAKGRVAEALSLNALSPLAVLMIAGTWWSAQRMSRIWGPCLAAFGAYGLFRVIF